MNPALNGTGVNYTLNGSWLLCVLSMYANSLCTINELELQLIVILRIFQGFRFSLPSTSQELKETGTFS